MLKLLKNLVEPPAIEQRAVFLHGKRITYTLKRSRNRRSIGLHIDERGLTVSVPIRSSEIWLRSVLQEKAHWVVTRLDGWQQANVPADTNWSDGGKIAYLGDLLSLRVVQSLFVTPAYRRNKELLIFVINGTGQVEIENSANDWYREEAEQLFSSRVAYYAPLLNVVPSAIKLSSARTQWGCCTAKGVVLLNLNLIKLPLRLIDYVVVHELAHLREMNHSTKFWDVVKIVCPDYASLRDELRNISIINY